MAVVNVRQSLDHGTNTVPMSNNGYFCVKNERQDWLTNEGDSVVRPDAQAKTCGMFSDVRRCSETGTKFRSRQFVTRLSRAVALPTDRVLP